MSDASATTQPEAREASGWRRFPRLEAVVALDLRSLALFRICLGAVMLGDLAFRARDLQAHYTDAGILPRSALTTSSASSLHAFSGSAWFEAVLMGLAAVVAVSYLLGYRTRAAGVLSFILLLSLHNRNPLITQGGDLLMRLLVLWGLFLPLGAFWSLDRRLGREPAPPATGVVSVATAAFIFQLCFVYWFSVALKSDPAWWGDGTAVYYALSLDSYTTSLGRQALTWPGELLRFFTWATVVQEAVVPALLFVPVFTGRIRMAVVVSFVLFHLVGLNLFLEVGLFPYVCTAGWLALLPGGFWDAVLRRPAPASPVLPWRHLPASLNLLALAMLGYVLLWNLRTVDDRRFSVILPHKTDLIGEGGGLAQSWAMFAPRPPDSDGWYVVVATWDDGTQLDPFRGGDVTWERPALVSATYRNDRWRKYLFNLLDESKADHRQQFARWLFRTWDVPSRGGSRLRRVEVYFMLEVTPPPGGEIQKGRVRMAVWPPPPVNEEAP